MDGAERMGRQQSINDMSTPDVRRFRVYARDLMPGDAIVASWRDGKRIKNPVEWKVESVIVRSSTEPAIEDVVVVQRAGPHTDGWYSPTAMFSVDREV